MCKPVPRTALMVCPQFRPIVGGYERSAEALSAWMAVRGMRVTVVTERRSRDWPRVERLSGFEIRRLPSLYVKGVHILSTLVSLACFLLVRGRRFAVWHVHQYGWYGGVAIGMGRLLRRPVVLKITNQREYGIAAVAAGAFGSSILTRLLAAANACVVISRETRDEALAFGYPPDRIVTVPNGVDGTIFQPSTPEARVEQRAALGLAARGIVLSVARMYPEKNIRGLIEAWALVAAKAEGWVLVVLGDGPLRPDIEKAIRDYGVSSSVRLIGQVAVPAPWFRASDVFVLSSHAEGLSNTTLEAMASGLPVVSTRVSGSHETVKRTGAGLVVDVADMPALAAALLRLIGDAAERARMGAAARRAFDQSFSIETVGERMLSLYAALTTQGRAATWEPPCAV